MADQNEADERMLMRVTDRFVDRLGLTLDRVFNQRKRKRQEVDDNDDDDEDDNSEEEEDDELPLS